MCRTKKGQVSFQVKLSSQFGVVRFTALSCGKTINKKKQACRRIIERIHWNEDLDQVCLQFNTDAMCFLCLFKETSAQLQT